MPWLGTSANISKNLLDGRQNGKNMDNCPPFHIFSAIFVKRSFMKIALWIAQILLAITLLWAAYTKWFTPAEELAAMWPWTGDHPDLAMITGIFDLLGGLGLILPALLNIKLRLTVFAAYGVIALMISAIVFHFSRGEASGTGFNFFVIALAGFIAWGRSRGRTTG